MTPLPWTPGPDSDRQGTAGGEVVVMATRLRLRRFRDIPAFMAAAMRLRRTFTTSPGGVGLSLHAQPARRTFWTLSAWTDRDALAAYTAHPGHVAVMRRFRPLMAGSTFTTWTQPVGRIPTWDEARSRLAVAAPAAVGGAGADR